jgi:hypothetical protein
MMGVDYAISCKDCKITRDLGKFKSWNFMGIKNKSDAINCHDNFNNNSFSESLIISFIVEHKGHNVVLSHDVDGVPMEYDKDFDFFKAE